MEPASCGSPELGRVGSGQEDSKTSRVRSDRVRRFAKFRGSCRVWSRRLKILAGRVESGQKTSRNSRGSGRVGSRRLEILTGRVS